jgi:hypothetical protein
MKQTKLPYLFRVLKHSYTSSEPVEKNSLLSTYKELEADDIHQDFIFSALNFEDREKWISLLSKAICYRHWSLRSSFCSCVQKENIFWYLGICIGTPHYYCSENDHISLLRLIEMYQLSSSSEVSSVLAACSAPGYLFSPSESSISVSFDINSLYLKFLLLNLFF